MILIKKVYVNSLSCVKVKGSESDWSRINSGVRPECIIFPWLSNVYMDEVKKKVKMGIRRRGMRVLEDGREWRLP